jgi:hypothetical protein
MSIPQKIPKFKLISKHKKCSFCTVSDIPVVMEVKGGHAICSTCINDVATAMEMMQENSVMPAFRKTEVY